MFHLPEEIGQVRAVEHLVEPAAAAAVAVLAGERAAVATHQTGGKTGDVRHAGYLGRAAPVDERPNMQAARPGVGVVGDRRAQPGAISLDLMYVVVQMLHRHGRVLDKRHGLHIPFHRHQQTQPDFAHAPDSGHGRRFGGSRQSRGTDGSPVQQRCQPLDAVPHDRLALSLIFNNQQAIGAAIDHGSQQPSVFRHIAAQAQAQCVQQFDGRGAGLQNCRDGQQRCLQPVEMQQAQTGMRRPRNQIDGDLGHNRQRALRAADELSQSGGMLRRQPVEVIPPTPPPVTGRIFVYHSPVIWVNQQPAHLFRYANS